ncbi:uncharacterized protein BDR25DRAFT_238612 [Lindgomyces ingoldianus]|uniref:Uncharacterized protein n=1 Tax=Lindgomyces ingoldianus TaxID=673940 RepID=A0ACB6QGA7_9PLEO|nr:uncharacterized protein BDR25DRAFT_238612 [Lindgomyces ingoldianus]KAF2466018.1 hypothetical protein BDR25DRAFT_238612 [Lindgomyces ingoldianus]
MLKGDVTLEAESQTALIYSLSIIFVTLSTASVGLRLYTRGKVLSVLGPDDITITIAQVLAIAVSVTTILEAIWGLGQHTKFVPLESTLKQLKCLYSNILIYNAAQIITKISFLIQYRRLFPGTGTQRVCLWLLVFVVAWGITQEFLAGLACSPLAAIVPKMADKCISPLPIWYLTSSMNIVTDFMIFVIPVPSVLKLQMRTRQKLLLCALFCLGFFACIISLVRLSTLHKGINTTDPMWDNAPTAYWSVVELNCGILCACLPTLRPLISKIVPRFLSTKNGTCSTTRISHQLSTLQKKSRAEAEMDDRIYIQKEVELHSTTELRTNAAGYPPSLDDGSQHGSSPVRGYSKEVS